MTVSSDFTQWEKRIPRTPIVDRDDFIVELCRGKRIVHLGACDAPMSLEKAERGELLHQKLGRSAASLHGLDNDRSAIELLRTKFGIVDIELRDLSIPPTELSGDADVVVCADVIEHVTNTGALLDASRALLGPKGILVVSTINALSIKQALRTLLGREPVHPDHVAYFSYGTLGQLLLRFGFALETCHFFAYPAVHPLSAAVFSAVYSAWPRSADGLVVVARRSL